jgi:hypothetical protein
MRDRTGSCLRVFVTAALLAGVLCLPIGTAHAQSTATADSPTWKYNDWHFAIGVYGWLQNVHGDLENPDGTNHDFTIPFSEIITTVETGIEAVGEIGWRNWFVVFDGTWATLGGDRQGQVFDLDVEYKQEIYDIHAGYGVIRHARQVENKPGKKPWSHVTSLDVMLGGRYFGSQLTLTETTHLTGRVHGTETDSSRWDPFLGVRGAQSLSNRWLINLSADIGGFGIGDAADFSYQVDANVGFRISHPLSAFVGYRVLGYDLGDDSGGSSDITQYGPKIGAAVAF